jgi:hypothetical protein
VKLWQILLDNVLNEALDWQFVLAFDTLVIAFRGKRGVVN